MIVGFAGCSTESQLMVLRARENAAIAISIEKQEVELVKSGKVVKVYPCSTARAGVGSEMDSGKTPLGRHRIAAKIGQGLPAGAVLRERAWTGQVWTPEQQTQEDLILSRILWLDGVEKGKNRGGSVDTWNRYIYIHGTNRIDELGRPASGGCIRMDPHAVIELFNAVDEGSPVLITED
ncbi:MAG: L,D-transpeptidase [Planctomycetaceae bacterium]|nr:L,D-transpeptidase [Planctomycetaceae bacterium]